MPRSQQRSSSCPGEDSRFTGCTVSFPRLLPHTTEPSPGDREGAVTVTVGEPWESTSVKEDPGVTEGKKNLPFDEFGKKVLLPNDINIFFLITDIISHTLTTHKMCERFIAMLKGIWISREKVLLFTFSSPIMSSICQWFVRTAYKRHLSMSTSRLHLYPFKNGSGY